MDHPSLSHFQRDRSRSPRRRSPDNSHHRDRARSLRSPRHSRRRSYSPRNRSRSREEYRSTSNRRRTSRSPAHSGGLGGQGASYAGSTSGYLGGLGSGVGVSRRSTEDRTAAKDAMMQSLRDSSQQDRRVYVGNLSYDVKWHHLKDFMRQGESLRFLSPSIVHFSSLRVPVTFPRPGLLSATFLRRTCVFLEARDRVESG